MDRLALAKQLGNAGIIHLCRGDGTCRDALDLVSVELAAIGCMTL